MTLYGQSYSRLSNVILSIVGLLILIYGGHLLVKAAVFLAHQIGIDEQVVGLTIVAVGSSLPELATSLVAVIKKKRTIFPLAT